MTMERRRNEEICCCLRGTQEQNTLGDKGLQKEILCTTEKENAGGRQGWKVSGKPRVLALKVCSMDQQCQQHLEICEKYKFLGHTQSLNQELQQGLDMCF